MGDRLDDLDVPPGGIVDAHPGSGLGFGDPDGLALEFSARRVDAEGAAATAALREGIGQVSSGD